MVVSIPVIQDVPGDGSFIARLHVAHFTATSSKDLENKVNRWLHNYQDAVIEELRYSSIGAERDGSFDPWSEYSVEYSVLILYRVVEDEQP